MTGSNSDDNGGLFHSQSRPGAFSLSRCRINKYPSSKANRKLRTNSGSQCITNNTSIGSVKQHITKRSRLIKTGHKVSKVLVKSLPIPSFRMHDLKVNRMENALFNEETSPAKKPKAIPLSTVPRPSVPNFDTPACNENGDKAVSMSDQQKDSTATLTTIARVPAASSKMKKLMKDGPDMFLEASESNGNGKAVNKENISINQATNDPLSELSKCAGLSKTTESNAVDHDNNTTNTNFAVLPSATDEKPGKASTKIKSGKVSKMIQPTHEELTKAVDDIFATISPSQITKMSIKQFMLSMEQNLQVILSAKSKNLAKKRLCDHINSQVAESSSTSQQEQQQQPRFLRQNFKVPSEHSMQADGALPEANTDATTTSAHKGPVQSTTATSVPGRSTSTTNLCLSGTEETNNIETKALESDEQRCQSAKVSVASTINLLELSDSDEENFEPVEINRKLPRKKKASVPDLFDDTIKNDVVVEDQPQIAKEIPQKRKAATTKQPTKRKAACKLCKTCPCKTKITAESSPRAELDLNKLQKSERLIDRKLENRLDELEREAERYEGEADRIRRELKKRARLRLRREHKNKNVDDKTEPGTFRFLPEGRTLDQQLDLIESVKMPREEIKKAQLKLFGKEKQSLFQPTLTQMFRGENKESDSEQLSEGNPETMDVEKNSDNEKESNEEQSQPENTSVDDSLDSLPQDDDHDDGDVAAHRVVWRNGCNCGGADGNPNDVNGAQPASLWGTLVNATLQRKDGFDYGRGFHRIFVSDSLVEDDEDPGLDHLLGLFQDVPSAPASPSKSGCATPPPSRKSSPIDITMLTPRGKKLAIEIQGQVMTNSEQVRKLESLCPHWRENVAYALHQRQPAKIDETMDNIRRSKARLAKMKASFLKAMQEQESVLDVFELSLEHSRKRFPVDSEELPYVENVPSQLSP